MLCADFHFPWGSCDSTMDDELPLRSLTIHLSKENQSPESLIENTEGITTKTVVVGRRTNCPLFIKPSIAKPPSWASFFEPMSRRVILDW